MNGVDATRTLSKFLPQRNYVKERHQKGLVLLVRNYLQIPTEIGPLVSEMRPFFSHFAFSGCSFSCPT